MNFTVRQIEALLVVARFGSMTRAGRELGISQPAVSRLLSDLETTLGFKLLDRRDGRLVPSRETQIIIPDIRRVIQTMDRIEEIGTEIASESSGHLRVACLPGFATSHLPQVVVDFLRDREGMTLTLEPDRPERIMEWIIGEQYDCGITDSFEGHPAVESELVSLRSVCVFPEGHPFETRASIAPGDLRRERLIHPRRDSVFFREMMACFRAAEVEPDLAVETRQFTAACELVLRGLGVAIVSAVDAAWYGDRGLPSRPFEGALRHKISLVRPINKPPSMLTLQFLEAFRQSIEPFRA